VNQVAQINQLSANLIAQLKVYRRTLSQYAIHGLPKLLRLQNTALLLETLYQEEQCENNEYRKQHSRMGSPPLDLGMKNLNFDPQKPQEF
jgi:hypothetical protein